MFSSAKFKFSRCGCSSWPIGTRACMRTKKIKTNQSKKNLPQPMPLNRNNKNAPNFDIEGCGCHDAYLRSTKLLGRHL